jgi:hypothetical protein
MKTILFVLCVFIISYCQTDEVVVVADIVNQGNLSEKNIKRVRDCVRFQVNKNKRFILLGPDIMAMMLQGQGLAIDSNCSDLKCLVKLGNDLTTKKVIGGVLRRSGNTIEMNLKMVDVAGNKILNTASINVKTSIEELINVHIPGLLNNLMYQGQSTLTSIAEGHSGKNEPGRESGNIKPDTVRAAHPEKHGSKDSFLKKKIFWIPLSAIIVGGAVVGGYLYSERKNQDNGNPSGEISLDDAPPHPTK